MKLNDRQKEIAKIILKVDDADISFSEFDEKLELYNLIEVLEVYEIIKNVEDISNDFK